MYDYTPMQTPSFMHNAWMTKNGAARKYVVGATPLPPSQTPSGSASETPFNPIDPQEMEEEVERLDRNWYQMDDGYDERNNPFIGKLMSSS